MAYTVPKGYVFWDVSAKKSYAAEQTFPTLGNGDYLCPATSTADGYYQVYYYYTSNTNGDVSWTNGWYGHVQSSYTNKAQQPPFNSLAGKPVRAFSYYKCTFTSSPDVSGCTNLYWLGYRECTNMTTAPVLPSGLKSINYLFYKTKVKTADFTKTPNVEHAYCAFSGVTNMTTPPNISVMTKLKDLSCMFQGCTALTTAPTLPSSAVDLSWMFYGCTALTTAPTIPANVTSVWQMFYGCTSLKGTIIVNTNKISSSGGCFAKTSATNQIILHQPANDDDISTIIRMAKTSTNGNVFAGFIAEPKSFTAIRGTYELNTQTNKYVFTENVNGDYCKLEFSYTLPYLPEGKVRIPYLSKNVDGVTTNIKNNVTWHATNLDGTVITEDGIVVSTIATKLTTTAGRDYYNGKLITVYQIGEDSASFDMQPRSIRTYNETDYAYKGGTLRASLTLGNMIIDINTSGNGIAFGDEASENLSGILIAKPLYISLDTNASAGTIDGDLYAAIHNFNWDSGVLE